MNASKKVIGADRICMAGFLALMVLAIVLPCTGRIEINRNVTPHTTRIVDRPLHVTILLGLVAIPLSCIFIGAQHSHGLEALGWLLLAMLLIFALFKGG